jgi:hypothetical protein
MALDVDVVLWALRGFDPEHRGLPADEIARFIAKDATLSDHYTSREVTVALESLVSEGIVICTSERDANTADVQKLFHATKKYRLATAPGSSCRQSDSNGASDLGYDALAPTSDRTLGVESDEETTAWRRRAEVAEDEVVRARDDIEELRVRVQELESALIEQERTLHLRQSETARRAAIALANAQNELQRLATSTGAEPTARRALRGNWLR